MYAVPMSTPSITQRLRSRHLIEHGYAVVELCEEGARTIEGLREQIADLVAQIDYLSASSQGLTWENDI